MSATKSTYKPFTPNVSIEIDDRGRPVQTVDGQQHVLSPTTYNRVIEYQNAGLDDDEIAGWLEMT